MQFNKVASVTLDKTLTMREIVLFLSENPKTEFNAIIETVKKPLRETGVIGMQKKHIGGGTYTYDLDLHDDDYLLINECIYDLLYARVLTPGVNRHSLNLPFIHVSDKDKLEQYL